MDLQVTHKLVPEIAVLLGAVGLVIALLPRYFPSGLLFATVLSSVLAFWFAYVVTRPLGASFADWLAVCHQRGASTSLTRRRRAGPGRAS
ncbi:MAG: hypothetical protein H0X28_08595 [Solirubrobacterales bacterium]|nr:hypothetical protein [Solirubrobacterales bacterium]